MWPWFIAIVILLVAGGALGLRWLHRASLGIPLMQVTVSTRDGIRYFVRSEFLHPQVQPVERVWLALLSAAKMLYVMGNDETFANSKATLLHLIERTAQCSLEPNADLAQHCGRRFSIVNSEGVVPAGTTFSAKLGYLDAGTRALHTKIPPYGKVDEGFFPDCWLAIVQSALPSLNELLRSRLRDSLQCMSNAYRNGIVDPSSIQGLRLPALCFHQFDEG